MDMFKPYAKAIVAFLIGLTLFVCKHYQVPLGDLTNGDPAVLAQAFIAAIAVYLVPNKPRDPGA